MKRKILFPLLMAFGLLTALVGCGSTSSSSSAASNTAPKDYAQIIHNARDEETNQYNTIYSGKTDGSFAAIDGFSTGEEYTQEHANEETAMLLELLDLKAEDTNGFAFSISQMMVQSYGVAIVKPAEGKTDTVKAALQGFVDGQRSAMEHYLPDQYEIAKAATVTVAPSGEVIMVCSENGAQVLDSIQKALA